MQKWKKIAIGLAVGAASFTVLYYGALFSVPKFVDLNKYKESVSNAIEKETGFKVLVEDVSFSKSLTPYLKIHLFHTIVLYPNDEVFLKLKEADLKVKILPLLFKKIVVKDAKLTRPIINITLYEDYSTSLEKYIDTKKTINTNGFKFDDLVYDTVCERYKIKFIDKSIDKIFYLEGDELLLKNIKLNDKAHIALKGAIYEDKKEYIKYDIDLISSLMTDKQQFTFSPFKPILDSNIKGSIFGHLKIDENKNIYGDLSIADLSLRLDDVLLSNNKANLKFNGKEVEIDSVLHTSKTDSAKMNGKISFGNKKEINMKTNAKNINLENLTKIISEITDVLNILNPLRDTKITGLLDADFSIVSDFKRLKSSGNAKLSDVVVKHKSLPYSLTDINAFVNLDNNKIQIENAQIKVNNTPVNIKGVINQDVSYNIDASSNDLNINNLIKMFGLQKEIPFIVNNGNLSFSSNISGVLNKNYNIKSKLNLNKLNLKYNNIPLLSESVSIDFNGDNSKYSGEVMCGNFSSSHKGRKISSENLKLSFDEKKIIIPENTISKELGLKVSGVINNYLEKPNGYINFVGDIPSSLIADFIKSEVKFPYKALGKINTNAKLLLSDSGINIKATLKANENNYLSYIVIDELFKKPSILTVDADIKDKKIDINELSLNEENPNKNKKIVGINGELELDKDIKLKDIKINIPESFTISTNFFGGEEISFKANLLINKTLSQPEIYGSAKVFKYNIKKYLTSLKNADVSFSKDNIRLIAPNVTVNDSLLNLIADIDSDSDLTNITVSNLQLNSMNLDLNSIFSIMNREDNILKSYLLNVEKGIITVNNLKILDLKARDISSDIKVEKNLIKLSDVEANAYGGFIEGRAIYDLSTGILNMDVSGKGIDIKNSLYDLCKIEDNIAGLADFNAKLSLITGKEKDVLKSLSGNMHFDAVNGKMGTLGKFEYYLYAQNLLYHGILNATLNRVVDSIIHDNTAQFRNASGSILFQNGYILTDGLQTTGPKMSLLLKGRHNMLSNQANIDIYGRISDELTNKLGSMGNVSIAEMISGTKAKKDVTYSVVPESLMNKIPYLYNQQETKTNTFKVNIYGDINSVNAINSFVWTVSDKKETEEENKMPDFSDMIQDL